MVDTCKYHMKWHNIESIILIGDGLAKKIHLGRCSVKVQMLTELDTNVSIDNHISPNHKLGQVD